MSRTVRPAQTATRDLLGILWQQPLWAVPFALFFWLLNGTRPGQLLLFYEAGLVFAFTVRLGLWATAHFVVPRLRLERDDLSARLQWGIGLYYVAAANLGSLAGALLIHFTFFPGFLGDLRNIAIWAVYSLLFNALFAGINYARVFYRSAVERGLAVERARAELAQAELRALRAQINPHFLFNTLNSIAALIAENPRVAEDVTTRLADVFRYALQASDRDQVRFADELGFLRAYLEIERVRFGDRLRLEETIADGLDALPVPSLLLQPLVENAIKHGVAPRAEGGRVGISARRERDRLVVEIADDGPGMEGASARSGAGFGLHSVRERLRAAGHGDALHIDSTPGRGTRVRVSLPIPSEATHPSSGGPR